jgi:hypothetical protein
MIRAEIHSIGLSNNLCWCAGSRLFSSTPYFFLLNVVPHRTRENTPSSMAHTDQHSYCIHIFTYIMKMRRRRRHCHHLAIQPIARSVLSQYYHHPKRRTIHVDAYTPRDSRDYQILLLYLCHRRTRPYLTTRYVV